MAQKKKKRNRDNRKKDERQTKSMKNWKHCFSFTHLDSFFFRKEFEKYSQENHFFSYASKIALRDWKLS